MIPYLRSSLLCFLPLAAVITLRGQAVLPAASAAQAEQPIHLSEFTVTADTSNTYAPAESMTGSRVATEIKNLPFNIMVVTNEMMQDFGLFEINENTGQFVPGLSNLNQSGKYNLRGFISTFQLRDGFLRLGRYSSSNVDRIEIIDGANAAIYGSASPGGLVNMISKAPKKQTTASLFVAGGNSGTSRETLETTGTVAPNTYYIMDLGLYDHDYNNQFGHVRNHEFYLSVRHDFSPETDLTVQYEFADRLQHSPPAAAPQIQDARVAGFALPGVKAPAAYVGIDGALGKVDQLGPYSLLDRNEGFLTGIFEHQISTVWSLRASGNLYQGNRWDFDQNVAAATESISTSGVATLARTAAPNKQIIKEVGGGVQADLLAVYRILHGSANAKTLFTFDYNDYYRYQPTYNIAGSALATYWTPIRVITVGQPIPGYYMGPGYTSEFPYWNGNSTLTQLYHNRAQDWGNLIRQQIYFFGDRLKTFANWRTDYVITHARDGASPKTPSYRATKAYYSPSIGVNYSATPAVALFLNYGRGFNPRSQAITAKNAATIYPGETSYGWDYGVKVVTPNGKFSSTFDGYYAMRYRAAVNERDPLTGLTATLPDGNQLVRGFEWTAYWFPTRNFTLYSFWGHINAKYRYFGLQYATVGRSPAKITPDNFGVTMKYEFQDGALAGLSTGLSWAYMRATPENEGNKGDHYNTAGVLDSSTLQWAVQIPSYYLVNWFAIYDFKAPIARHLRQSLQLNVNNVLNRDYVSTTGETGEPRQITLGYRLSY